jgi:DNA-binding LacI/PurR family transcriptional regulator
LDHVHSIGTLKFLSITHQVAEHLRGELLGGRWCGAMPGRKQLAEELGVSGKAVQGAQDLLEKEGLLVGQGQGRPSKIVLPENHVSTSFQVGLLDYDPHSRDRRLTKDLTRMQDNIIISPKTLLDLKMDVRRIASHVKSIKADAWIVCAGPRDVLEWFSQQPFPTFAMFGFMSQLPIAGVGPDSPYGYAESVRQLVALGHQRIVMLANKHNRVPEPNRAVRAFLDSLEAEGIQTGPYNLPDWETTNGGLHTMLDSLFKTTPPTVLIIDDKLTFFAVQQFLLKHGIRVPGDVSLVCHEFISAFNWCKDPIAYIHWDWAPVTRRIRSWIKNASQGKKDTKQNLIKPSFVPGKTLGPPPPLK